MKHLASVLLSLAVLSTACTRSAAPPATPTQPPAPPPAPTPTEDVPPSAPVATTPVIPEGCAEDGALALFAVTRENGWTPQCTALGESRVFVAWRTQESDGGNPTATLRIAIVEGGRIAWQSTESTATPTSGEQWTASPATRVGGTPGGLRVGLVASSGEDYHSDVEQAVIFRAEGEGRYTRVWQGEGNRDERAMDACFTVIDRVITFTDAHTLTVATSGTARFQNQHITGGELQRLRRECRQPARRSERVTLPE